MSAPVWDPEPYERFRTERSRPFHDLLARIPDGAVHRVADLGCGTGDLTRILLERWPEARVVGVDRSPEMLERARQGEASSRLCFVESDLAAWEPAEAFDRIVSNATLQWVPGHAALLERLAEGLAPGGVLAVQVPNNGEGLAHQLLAELATEPFWRARLSSLPVPAVESAPFYLEILSRLSLETELWETVYHHVLPEPESVLSWLEGTTLRPALSMLPSEESDSLREELGARIAHAYERNRFGVVFPFRRLFFVARRA